MARTTSRFGLILPDEDDFYSITDQNRNMQQLDSKAVLGDGAVRIKVLTQAEYDAMSSHDAQTLFIVLEG